MAQLIDGKLISQQIKDELKEEVAQFKAEGIDICLAVIQVGSDPASSVYVRNKKKACAYIGVESRSYELPEETSEEELIKLVEELNADELNQYDPHVWTSPVNAKIMVQNILQTLC